MSSIIAESVLAATHKLVRQAMTAQWQDVQKTVQERRELLENLSASASPHDRQWLGALQQAMAESDAAVAKIAPANVLPQFASQTQTQGTVANRVFDTPDSAAVDSMMELLRQSR